MQKGQTLKVIHTSIVHMQQWTMRYKGTPLFLYKRMKPEAEQDNAWIQMLIHSYE